MVKYQQRENFQLWHDMDVEDAKSEGRSEGSKIGKVNYAKGLIYEKYLVDDLEWLNNCREEQFDKILKIIFKDISYEEFKNEINKHT